MRKTKIVATIGPASDSEEKIKRLIESGVNVFRFNMKHGTIEWHSERMERVEAICRELKQRVAILMDLQGPEVRIDTIPEGMTEVRQGEHFWFVRPGNPKGVSLDHPDIFNKVEKGATIFADDGFLEFRVERVSEEGAEVEVIEGGPLKPRKTVNFPGTHLDFPTLVEKDLKQLTLAARHHIDYVALSFVRSADDIETLRKQLVQMQIAPKIVAKIEHPDAVGHFDEILEAADAVMVARGDLGIEYPMEEVPGLQKMMVLRCIEVGKPVIVATQMLESMITNSRPTRAEVSDVANAVYDMADAVMLSAESASGNFPVRAVKMMASITEKSEKNALPCMIVRKYVESGQTGAVVAAAAKLAETPGIENLAAFVVLTETGKSARYLARMRPTLPIIALTPDEAIMDQLQLVWGVMPVKYDYSKDERVSVEDVVEKIQKAGLVAVGEKVIMVFGEIWGRPELTSVIRIQDIV